jgi:chitodextrinase
MVPDQSHSVVTSGYGTFGKDDYVTAEWATDGSAVIAYVPTVRTLTVNLSKLSTPVTGRWFDPTSGTYAGIAGSPFNNAGAQTFTPPGNNSAGAGDWVLVLDKASSPLQINSSSLPQGTAGIAYSSQLMASGGSQPYSWSLTQNSPALPPGLTLSTGGLLSGTPASNGLFSLTGQVMDSTNGVATRSLALTVASLDTSAPTIPAGVTATAVGAGQINVSWAASTDNVGVTGYLVDRSQGAGSSAFAQVGTPTGTNFADTGLAAATVFNYRVRAADAAGNLSGYSTVTSATTASNVPSAGLVTAYGFNEGTGTTVKDASSNGITGTLSGATWTTAGKYGDALSFNGTSGYVNLGNPSALALTGSMTLEAWVMATGNPPDDGQIIAKSDNSFGWQLKTTPDTGVRTFGIGVSPNSSSLVQRYSKTVLSLNTWYHVAAVYNAGSQTLDIYVNGVLDDGVLSGTVPSAQSNNSSQSATIGRRTGGFYFKGTIDEVRVYSRALGAAEIQSDMNTAIGSSALTVIDTTPPSAPAGLTASAASATQVNLSWTASTDNVGVTGYLVERRQGAGSTAFAQIGTPTGTAFSNTGLSAGTVYNYRVRATDAAGYLSAYSSIVSSTTPSASGDTTPPTAPSGLRAGAGSTGQINLSWTASTDNVGVAAYLVERRRGSGSFSQITTTPSTNFTDTGLSRRTTYSYRVRATDAAGNLSGYSNVASATAR